MILDQIENWNKYPLLADKKIIFEFLQSLKSDIADGECKLQGDQIFARVMSYRTRSPQEGILESHRTYIDIQIVLRGDEQVHWWPVHDLQEKAAYDALKDALFYHVPPVATGRFILKPGMFAVFFSQDAHMTSLVIGDKPQEVRKVVVKLRYD